MSTMQIDMTGDVQTDPLAVEATARRAEADGYDGLLVAETKHDPFVALTLAGRATHRIALTSGIAVAFARNPMSTAILANDLQLISGGRFSLGLGSQIQPHIERRFSMPWSHPAPRMREYIAAIRAIWHSWSTGDRLRFRGEFYSHTLMTPFFDPGPTDFVRPPILLAAVGQRMTEVAGEVADGCLCHSLTTRRYLDEVTVPALTRGRAAAGREPAPLSISLAPFIVVGRDQAELDTAVAATRKQIAFYGSTPAYRPVFELHGWSGLHEQLNQSSKRGQWDEMAAAIDDTMLAEFAVLGDPAQVGRELHARFGDLASRISFNTPYQVDPTVWPTLLAAVRSASSGSGPSSSDNGKS